MTNTYDRLTKPLQVARMIRTVYLKSLRCLVGAMLCAAVPNMALAQNPTNFVPVPLSGVASQVATQLLVTGQVATGAALSTEATTARTAEAAAASAATAAQTTANAAATALTNEAATARSAEATAQATANAAIPSATLGQPSGVPQLDGNALVPANQIPPLVSAQPSYAANPAGAFNSYSASLYALYSPLPLLSSYTGQLYVVRRESDNATLTVSGVGNSYNSAALALWANGADLYVTTAYDQSGNGRTLTQPTVAAQPKLNLDGAYPTFVFDGLSSFLPATAPLAGWLNGVSAASVVVLRKADLLNTATNKDLVNATTGTSNSTRISMGVDSTVLTDAIQGRRLDTDALNRSGGFVPDNAWDTEIGRWNFASAAVYHSTGLNTETRAFQTAGITSPTAPENIDIGSGPGNGFYAGKIAAIALYGSDIGDVESAALATALAAIVPSVSLPTPTLDWGSLAQTGTYTLAPGLINYTVDTPDGTTPAYTDLGSLQYHHHTKVAVAGGRVWVAYSGAADGEEQGGQITEINSSANSWATSTGPQVVVPPQSLPFQLTGGGDVNGTRISYPRSFVTYGGNLYLVAAVDQVNAGVAGALSYQQGMALVAVECNSDGTIGAPFLISPAAYAPLSGVTTIAYNSTLGPALFAAASLNGTWGGSAPGQIPSAWQGFVLQGGMPFVEPSTISLSSNGLALLRIWRKQTGNGSNWLYISKSLDGGHTWSKITRTNIPSAATETTGIQLANGEIAIIGNPQQGAGATRDPLYIATFDGTTGVERGILAVRQGLSNTPTYPNGSVGGAQYPGVASDGTLIYISYSITKQQIGLTTIPIASLP